MSNNDYWADRQRDRLLNGEQYTLDNSVRLLDLYDRSEKLLNKRIESIYANYSKKGILEPTRLLQVTNEAEKIRFINDVTAQANRLGLDITKVYDDRYLQRLTNVEARRQEIYLRVLEIAKAQMPIHDQMYSGVIQNAYTSTQKDLKAIGANVNFTTLNPRAVDAILNSVTDGRHYSKTIWTNTEEFARRVSEEIGAGLLTGTPLQQLERRLRLEFDAEKKNTMRVVRTEFNLLANKAELQSYKDDGIEEYEYLAELDDRVSEICESLNGEIYKIEDAQVGINYPPMHPNCRSTTTPVIDLNKMFPDKTQDTSWLGKGTDRSGLGAEIQDRWRNSMNAQMTDDGYAQGGVDWNAVVNNISGSKNMSKEEKLQALKNIEPLVPKTDRARTTLNILIR
jgi:SPP1 gp7 family putative phage head morphogenesis protein